MTRHDSLAAYHARRRVEAQLELERLRHQKIAVRHIPVHVPGLSEPCNRPHIGPGTAVLIGLGVLTLFAVIAGAHED